MRQISYLRRREISTVCRSIPSMCFFRCSFSWQSWPSTRSGLGSYTLPPYLTSPSRATEMEGVSRGVKRKWLTRCTTGIEAPVTLVHGANVLFLSHSMHVVHTYARRKNTHKLKQNKTKQQKPTLSFLDTFESFFMWADTALSSPTDNVFLCSECLT